MVSQTPMLFQLRSEEVHAYHQTPDSFRIRFRTWFSLWRVVCEPELEQHGSLAYQEQYYRLKVETDTSHMTFKNID
jgi:hypothetical protein